MLDERHFVSSARDQGACLAAISCCCCPLWHCRACNIAAAPHNGVTAWNRCTCLLTPCCSCVAQLLTAKHALALRRVTQAAGRHVCRALTHYLPEVVGVLEPADSSPAESPFEASLSALGKRLPCKGNA